MATAQLTPDQMAKLTALTMKLGTDESTALSKALRRFSVCDGFQRAADSI